MDSHCGSLRAFLKASTVASSRIVSLGLLYALVCAAQAPSAGAQKRVSPDAYSAAPAAIRNALKKEGCELPETQHWDATRLNLVSGHFGDPTQIDWAAICISRDGTTRALLFWGSKSAPCPAEIHHGWALNSRFPAGQAGSLYLLAAPRKQIEAYREFFGDAHDNPVTHDGVEVGGEEASLIYYCDRGRWLELQGND